MLAFKFLLFIFFLLVDGASDESTEECLIGGVEDA